MWIAPPYIIPVGWTIAVLIVHSFSLVIHWVYVHGIGDGNVLVTAGCRSVYIDEPSCDIQCNREKVCVIYDGLPEHFPTDVM